MNGGYFYFMAIKDPVKRKEAQRRADAKRAGRTRNYATVVYPESAPENWLIILEQLFVPCLISPLHDRDVNSTGEPKKSHYHVLFMFDCVKTKEQVKVIIEQIGGVGCEAVNSLRGYARYLLHLDNPEKAQYNIGDVRQFGGVDYRKIISLASDIDASCEELLDFCEKYQIISFSRIRRYIRATGREDWAQALRIKSIYISMTLKSMAWEMQSGVDTSIDDLLKIEKQ